MCLGIPGEIVSRQEDGAGQLMGKVRFAGIVKEVCLACVPEARIGEWVIVHAGFAITVLDEEEARCTLALFEEIASFDPGPGSI